MQRIDKITSISSAAMRNKALRRIQALARGFLQRRQDELMKSTITAQNNLRILEKGVVELCGVYFHYKMLTDHEETGIWFSLRPVTESKPIINMEVISLDLFTEDEVADIKELTEHIKDNLNENCEEIMIDDNGEYFDDWREELKLFIQEDLKKPPGDEEGEEDQEHTESEVQDRSQRSAKHSNRKEPK